MRLNVLIRVGLARIDLPAEPALLIYVECHHEACCHTRLDNTFSGG